MIFFTFMVMSSNVSSLSQAVNILCSSYSEGDNSIKYLLHDKQFRQNRLQRVLETDLSLALRQLEF
jgi:hypothetical protein